MERLTLKVKEAGAPVWNLLTRLIVIFDYVLYKLADRKESSKLIGEGSEVYDLARKRYIDNFDGLLNQTIRAFRPATKIVLEMLNK